LGRRKEPKRPVDWNKIRMQRQERIIKQCPVCCRPDTLIIELRTKNGVKSAHIWCYRCGFTYVMENIPEIADKFWVYDKLLQALTTSRTQA
jgi:transcription elongation factor Elf1